MAATTETTVHHLIDKRFVGITPEGTRVAIDGERDHPIGMRPMQLVLNAVGACAGYDIVAMIAKRRLEIRSYEIVLEGDRAEGVPSPYTRIRALHRFDVPGLAPEMAQRFAELGMTKYCSVAASLKAEIDVRVELLHDAPGSQADPEAAPAD